MAPAPRIALIANEASGGGTSVDEVAARLREAGGSVVRLALESLGDLGETRADRVAAAGGDGTVGAVAAASARVGLRLALVPTGTANDLARALDVPLDVADACELAVRGTKTRRLDLAWLDERPFVNVASAGLAPEAARAAESLKRPLGRLAYVLGALRAATATGSLRVRVECDGAEAFAGRAWQVIVSNTGAFGGGSEVGAADPSDGLLDVTIVPAESRARLALDGIAMRAGRIAERRGVVHRRAGAASVEAPAGAEWDVDGELVPHGGGRFRVEPGALEIVVG